MPNGPSFCLHPETGLSQSGHQQADGKCRPESTQGKLSTKTCIMRWTEKQTVAEENTVGSHQAWQKMYAIASDGTSCKCNRKAGYCFSKTLNNCQKFFHSPVYSYRGTGYSAPTRWWPVMKTADSAFALGFLAAVNAEMNTPFAKANKAAADEYSACGTTDKDGATVYIGACKETTDFTYGYVKIEPVGFGLARTSDSMAEYSTSEGGTALTDWTGGFAQSALITVDDVKAKVRLIPKIRYPPPRVLCGSRHCLLCHARI